MVPMDPQKSSSTRQTSSTPHSLSDLSGPRQSFHAATVKMWPAALWLHLEGTVRISWDPDQTLMQTLLWGPLFHSFSCFWLAWLAKISVGFWLNGSISIPDLPLNLLGIIRFGILWSVHVRTYSNIRIYKIPKLMLFTQRTCKSHYASPKLVLVLKQFARYEKCVQNHTNACKVKGHVSHVWNRTTLDANWFARNCEVAEHWHCGAFKWL